MKLFIVESPNKCSKLRGYLGSEYKVAASVGHIRQIPKKGINIDIKNDFTPKFEVSSDKKKVVKELKTLAKEADEIILATDPDREGEAISWHIYDLLPASDKKKCRRVTFSEITKKAVLKSLDNKREIDMDLVDAQKARQVLDRLIGYKVSPVLWYSAHIPKSSAGRVQSIALKLVCDRQKEIEAFKPQDYWFIESLLRGEEGDFWAKVVTKNKDNKYTDETLAKKDLETLKKARYKVAKIERKEKKIKPYPPFDTNSLQATCSTTFNWSLSKSKTIAQKLYEQGLVTYIRSDSFNIAEEALDEVRGLIKKAASADYLPAKANKYSKKSSAASQEAHECIRPTHVYDKGDDITDKDEKKMYKLIRDRFIACQMNPMIVDSVTYHVETNSKHKLIAKGQTIKFDGWSKVYTYSKTKEEILPAVKEKEELKLEDIKKTKHSTNPPAKYNEASLAKKMEEEGVGRPSTRDSIITAIQKKGYVEKEKEKGKGKKGLHASALGMAISEYLSPNFKDFFMNIKYTSSLENDLDEIANGSKSFLDVVGGVYSVLQDHIKDAKVSEEGEKNAPKSTGESCPKCDGGEVMEKFGRFGKFFSCSNYPECKTIFVQQEDGSFAIKKKAVAKKSGKPCPKCQEDGRDGELLIRKNRRDNAEFLGCSLYPKCKYTENMESNGS